MDSKTQWNLIQRIKAIAETGLAYAENGYDKERYQELRKIGLQLMEQQTGTSLQQFEDFFLPPKDYPTPKVDVRAFILNEKDEVLMAQESIDGQWSIPGGWADIGVGPSQATLNEVHEETGLQAEIVRLLAIYDKRSHPHPPEPFYIYKLMYHCRIVGGTLNPGFDIKDAAWFAMDNLPPLSEDRILKSQLTHLFTLVKEGSTIVYTD